MTEFVGIGNDEKLVNATVTDAKGHHSQRAVAFETDESGKPVYRGFFHLFGLGTKFSRRADKEAGDGFRPADWP